MMMLDFMDNNLWLMHGDCLELMASIPDGSVDMVLCDLPYGTTRNKWDSVIPFELLWTHYWRVLKPNGAVVLTAQTPFDKVLGCSQVEYLKYEWVWEKPKATGHLNAKRAPMKAHENIMIFYRSLPTYNPQKTQGLPYKAGGGASKLSNYGSFDAVREGSVDGARYPRSVFQFTHELHPVHPTQKPVALMEYLIKTYTNEGETVLDNCAGSFTTGVACLNTNRNGIMIEKDPEYFRIGSERMTRRQQEINDVAAAQALCDMTGSSK